MRSYDKLRLISAVVLSFLGSSALLADTRNVVLLYDERTSLPGLSILDASLVRILAVGSPDAIEVFREEMDLSRFGSEAYLLELRSHLRSKYGGKQIDAAVAVMGPALDFLLQHGDAIFPSLPIIFCGIDRREFGDGPLPPNVTGVLVKRTFYPTLDVALSLHPDTTRIVVVAGTSEFDVRLLEQARNEFRSYEDRLEFTYLTELPLQNTLVELSRLPSQTVVLYLGAFRDGAGAALVPHDVAARVAATANAPVYGFVDQYLGYGIVGGHLYTLDAHGEQAAKLTLEVLAGAHPATLSLAEPAAGETQFDARQLERWNVNERDLPAGSVVLFREPTLWSQYRSSVIGVASIVALQACMIAALLLQRSRRRRAEAALRESEFRFRSMADTAPVLLWITDVDGTVTFFNKGWRDHIGDASHMALIDAWKSCVHPADLQNCVTVYEQRVASTSEFAIECRLQKRDGEYRWMLCTGVPRFALAGRFLGYIGSCSDVDSLREAESERQRHRAELAHVARVAMMGELTASIAHEVYQPLAAILANAQAGEMLLSKRPPPIDEVRQILADICADDQRATQIIRGVRRLLQRHEVSKKAIDLNGTIEEVVRLMRQEGLERGVEIRFTPPERSLCVAADRVQLQQVVLNLLMNAIEAMSAVPVGERLIRLRVESTGNGAATITVSDSGRGVSADNLSQLFEPFYTTKEAGLGMGLSITRTIVEAHGGSVWAENNPSAGAAFHVSLPLTPC